MLSKNFRLLFYLKKPKNYLKWKLPIYLRITIDAGRIELSTQRDCEPERWNSQSGRVNGSKEEIKSINVYLDSVQTKVYEAYRSLLDKNEPINVASIKNVLKGIAVKPRMVLDIFRCHNDQMQKLIAQDEYAKGTWIHFCTSCKHLENFILSKFNQKDLLVTQIDFAFISDFEFYLKRNICAHNTAMKYLSNFRKIVLLCLKNGWLPKDPFLGYKLARKEVHREVLTDNDLKLIAEKLFSTDRLT